MYAYYSQLSHRPVQLPVDFLLIPAEVLQVLHPFKEADHNAAAIGIDVGQHRDTPLPQNGVSIYRGGGISSLNYSLTGNTGPAMHKVSMHQACMLVSWATQEVHTATAVTAVACICKREGNATLQPVHMKLQSSGLLA